MNFTELVAQYNTAPEIPNDVLYDYLETNREDILNEARLGVDRVPKSNLGLEVRRRCKTYLMWLAGFFLWRSNPISENGYKPFSENIFVEEFYRPFVNLFVKKDPTKPINRQSDIKTRLLLWPRGGAKSTFDHTDSVQWILAFPSIRILYLTAEVSLATGFVGEIKGHFYWKEDPSWMNVFFPEFCVEEGKAGPADEFTCPVYAAKKTGRKEPTVFASSNGKAKAGWRFELIKADDAVTDTNSENDVACEKVSKRLFLSEKLLALGGYYIDYVGTRYADEDHYGVLLEQNVGDIVTTYGEGWEFHENRTRNMNVLIGRAMQIKPEVRRQLELEDKPVTYQNAGPEGVILLLPHLMSYSWCMEDFSKDEKSFEGQRNQNPRPASTVIFDRIMLQRCTVGYQGMPHQGAVTQVWDFAFSKKKGRDYSTGCSIMWSEQDVKDKEGKLTGEKLIVGYVQEIVRDRFNHLTLAQAVVGLAERHRPFVIGVENAGGSQFLEEQIKAEAVRKKDIGLIQTCSLIDWFAPDNQKEAKKVRMSSMYPHFLQGRLKLANYCMNNVPVKGNQAPMDLLYDEFEKCLTSHHHDDIPDVIAMQFRYAPRATIAIIENNENIVKRDPLFDMIFNNADQFGRIGFEDAPQISFMPDPEIYDDYIEADAPTGLTNILGAGLRA